MSTVRSAGIAAPVLTSQAPTWAIAARSPFTATRPPSTETARRRTRTRATRSATGSSCWALKLIVTATPVSRDQVVRRPPVEHAAVAHGYDAIAQGLGVGEFVSDEHDGGSVVAQLSDGGPDISAGGRVEALSEFVENHQAGPVQQGEHQEEALALAAAHSSERVLEPVGEPESFEQGTCVSRVGSSEQVHSLRYPHAVGQCGVLQLAADQGAEQGCVRARIQAENSDASGVRRAQALKALDGRGLASTVRADEAKDLTGGHGQIEVVDDSATPVGLGQPADFDYDVRRGLAHLIPPVASGNRCT